MPTEGSLCFPLLIFQAIYISDAVVPVATENNPRAGLGACKIDNKGFDSSGLRPLSNNFQNPQA